MTEYVTQNIRTVLKTFQNSAPKSLQGPGHSLVAATPLDATLGGGGGGGVNAVGAVDLMPTIAGAAAVVGMRSLSPCNSTAEHCHLSGTTASAAAATSNCSPTVPPPVALIKKEIFSSPEPQLEVGGNDQSTSITIVPPPPPELPQPILSSADSCSGELYETRLEGKTIGCFSLGGEMRLCLPQFLNNVLADFTLDQINRIFDELGIFCSQCTPDQLLEFKAAKILPSDVKASGLITRTDAERLCAALLHRSDRNSYISVDDIPKGAISFKVYHRCFGKCEAICTPDMYSYTKPTCIMCLECKGWFSPQKFVGHVHRKQENRTCHWGFDSRNWHEYLHVALDVENREKYQKILDELKEVEYKETLKAQRDLSYLKRKAEMFPDDAILGPPLLPPHQQLASSGKQRELLDIPSKKVKNLDESSAYQLEYQRYQALIYSHCVQQQRIGQMSAFRPWAPPKSFLQVPYNAVANLPYLSQEPPVLQNPERVVRNTDRERFERTYQPNVALAPRKSILTKEREKEQREREREREQREREQRERERIERERARELERARERERERSMERERERELRERELQQQKMQQQQQQQHVAITNLCEAELHIKQERANTPAEVPQSPPPTDEEMLLDHRRSNGPMEDETTMPMASPLSLSISLQHQQQQQQQQQQLQHKSNNIELLQLQHRRHSLHTSNSTSSTSSNSSSLSTHSGMGSEREQLLHSATSPQQQQLPAHLPPPNHARLQQHLPLQHQHHLQQQSPPSPQSPEEFSGSNEISSSTSPLPTQAQQHLIRQQSHLIQQQQQQQHLQSSNNSNLHLQQTIIGTVNQHAKLLPNSTSTAPGTISANSNNNNEMPSRIRISKNLINQPNIMRSPTPPPSHQHHHQHPHSVQQQQQQLLQHQQQYEHYKQQQQRMYQQHHRQQQHSPSQSAVNINHNNNSNMSSNSSSLDPQTTPAGLNLSTNIHSNGGAVVVKSQLQHHQQQQIQHPHQQQHPQQLQQNGTSHMGSEFELSTDTDDDSLIGEPDSSNMLAPWELAVEALKDTRPKDRERMLQLLQKLLQDNQQYRFDNLQLTEELRKRDKQICDLQEQLLHHQRQQQHHRHQQQLASGPLAMATAKPNGGNAATTTTTTTTESVIAKNDNCQNAVEVGYAQEKLRGVPLKKSIRREPDSAEISVVVMKQQQQQQSNCNGYPCTVREEPMAVLGKSCERDGDESDSEADDENKDDEDMEADDVKVKRNEATLSAMRDQQQEREREQECVRRNAKHQDNSDNEEDEEPQDEREDEVETKPEPEQHCEQHDRDNSRSLCSDSDDGDGDDDDATDIRAVKAPHTSAVGTPPTATTPISPDSAATAGQLFDSSNSSDEASMKKAQMSASNALAKMAEERGDAEDDEDEGEGEGDEDDEDDAGNGEEENDDDDNDDNEDSAERADKRDGNSNTLENRTTKATNTKTTTTNQEIKIKQEII